jgi:hypothetical protein
LQKTPSKVNFEGIFMRFPLKMPSKVKNGDSHYPANLDIVEVGRRWILP